MTSSAPRGSLAREADPPTRERSASAAPRARSGTARSGASASGVRVRRSGRGGDDGYRSGLVPGLKSGREAERLTEEIAFAATRLDALEHEPPGLYAEVAAGADIEERTWLAFLIAYLGPVDGPDPFTTVEAVRTPWAQASGLHLGDAVAGPRGAHDPARANRTIEAYRAWAGRAGSQAAALGGDPAWTPQRRFARAFERLALPGLQRDARFDLLVTLGRLGVYGLDAGSLVLGGENRVTVGAKRALGIGDPLLLDRRASELADACQVPLEALDLGLFNWERGARTTGGLPEGAEPSPERLDQVQAALGT